MTDETHQCPLCGKPMFEQKGFAGLWICEDGLIRLNEKPPFRFKCPGITITERGVREFKSALAGEISKRN